MSGMCIDACGLVRAGLPNHLTLRPIAQTAASRATAPPTSAGTATDEAVGIADRIQALVQEGVALDEIAVLFRCFNWGGTTYLRLQVRYSKVLTRLWGWLVTFAASLHACPTGCGCFDC